MQNSDYWLNRMRILEDALLDTGYDYVKNLEKQYDTAIRDIEADIARWYQRFAVNNEMSLSDARKLLNTKELKEFKWTVEEYIKYGRENALDGQWIKQLENASARVHVSRLESIKLQLQQQAEALAAQQTQAIEQSASKIYESSYYHTAYELQKGVGVGWTLHSINKDEIRKVLSKPWTVDRQTFSDRIWSNKQSLINTVNTELTQMIMRGAAPDNAIKAISERFKVSKSQAGRLVMTESAAFANEARKDCFKELDVEEYVIVETLDGKTCDLCASLDGKVYPMSEYQIGVTAPPFHPWCRGTTAPYFADMEGIGERWARDPKTGKAYEVPKDMTYREWRKKYVDKGISKAKQSAVGEGASNKKLTCRYTEITRDWYSTATSNSHVVSDLQKVTIKGSTYKVDGHNVVLDYSMREKEIAELLEKEFGGELYMFPRVNNPQRISTPDYLFRGESYDLKTIGKTTGKNPLFNRIKKAKGQSNNFIFDLTNCELSENQIENQIEKIFWSDETKFVNIIVIIKNKKF